MLLLVICVCVWQELIIWVVLWNFFAWSLKDQQDMEGLDGEGGTLKFSCVKVFDFMNIYLCFIEGVCVRERQPLPHSANHISGANFPSVCVYSAALLSPQHQSGSESEDLLGQILRYNDRSFYEVKLHSRWPVIALMGFSSFSSEHSQVLSWLKPPKFKFTSNIEGISLPWRTA